MWWRRLIGLAGLILCRIGIWHEDTSTGLGILTLGLILLCMLFLSDGMLDDIDILV